MKIFLVEGGVYVLVILDKRYCLNHFRNGTTIHGSINFGVKEFAGALNNYKKSLVGGEYIDTHAWSFTPKIFGDIITKLNELGMINLEVEKLCHTVWGRLEFVVILRKNSKR